MRLVAVTLADCKAFVAEHHRHNLAPHCWRFGVGLANDRELIGVAVARTPSARGLMAPGVLEISRTCTDGTPNANSMLYGAIARASKALGYSRLYTYTLADEPGTSLRAAGWMIDQERVRDRGWNMPSRPHAVVDGYGNERMPSGPRVRWQKDLAEPASAVTARYVSDGPWRRCAVCRKRFDLTRSDALYCRAACRQKAYRQRTLIPGEA